MTVQRIEPSRWAGFLGTVSETLIGKRAEFEPGPRVGESAARDTARAVGH